MEHNLDGLVQDCSISSTLATELLKSCIKSSISGCTSDIKRVYVFVYYIQFNAMQYQKVAYESDHMDMKYINNDILSGNLS